MPQTTPIATGSTDLQSTPRTDVTELSSAGRELLQEELDWVAGGLVRNCGPDGTVIHTPHGTFCD